MQFLSLKNGWKTYLVCGLGVAIGAAQALNTMHYINFNIPGAVDWVLIFLGGAALRHGVQAQAAKTAVDFFELLQMIKAQVVVAPADAQTVITKGSVIHTGNAVVTIGQPSPAGMTDAQERAETADLNSSQLGKG